MKLRAPRAFASFLVCSFALLLVYAFGLGMYAQGKALWENLPQYSQRISEIGDEVVLALETAEQDAYRI